MQGTDRWGGCYQVASSSEFVLTPRSHDVIQLERLPAHFDWRNVSGRNLVTPVRNQQLPHLCGSCWAFAVTGSLSDRLYIASRGTATAITLAPQVLLDLSNLPPRAGGCNGGEHSRAMEFIRMHGISDESCSPYQGSEVATWGEYQSVSARMCRVCDWDGACRFTEAGPRYRLSEHGNVLGVEQMMAEIYRRGPIACVLHSSPPAIFDVYNGTPEIIADDTVYAEPTHVVEVIGWGESSEGVPYWIGKNSYGTLWGLQGFFKLRRGQNDLLMESHNCSWGVVSESSFAPAHADAAQSPSIVFM